MKFDMVARFTRIASAIDIRVRSLSSIACLISSVKDLRFIQNTISLCLHNDNIKMILWLHFILDKSRA